MVKLNFLQKMEKLCINEDLRICFRSKKDWGGGMFLVKLVTNLEVYEFVAPAQFICYKESYK